MQAAALPLQRMVVKAQEAADAARRELADVRTLIAQNKRTAMLQW